MGSLYEVYALFDVMRENKLITNEEFGIGAQLIHDIGNQLGGFKNSLRKHKDASRSRY